MKMKKTVKKYKLKYEATDNKGIILSYPTAEIKAENEEYAYYEYFQMNGINFGTFEQFMEKPEHVRHWATSCEVVKDEK